MPLTLRLHQSLHPLFRLQALFSVAAACAARRQDPQPAGSSPSTTYCHT